MQNHQTPPRDLEEEWIVKYRAALNAAPIEQSLVTRLHAAFSNACSIVLSRSVTVVDRWVHWQSFLISPTPQPRLTGNERPEVSLRRSNRGAAGAEGRYKKAS
jgi:hypothetical protein